MAWLTLILETVTPCFLAGAYRPDEKADEKADAAAVRDEGLRTASLIGQWRFWLRACLGARDPDGFRDREDFLFGSPHGAGRQGAVWVRPGLPTDSKLKVVRRGTRTGDLAGAKYPLFEGVTTPIDPLAYLLGQGLYHHSQGLARPAIAAGQTFAVDLAAPKVRRDPVESRKLWRDLRHAIWLWQMFGGLGARSRRGWGSLQVQRIEGLDAAIRDEDERRRWRDWFPGPRDHAAADVDEQDENARRLALCRVLDLATNHLDRDELEAYPDNLHPRCAFTGGTTDPESGRAHLRDDEANYPHLGSCCAIVRKPDKLLDTWARALAAAGMAMLEIRSNAKGRSRQPADLLRVDDHDRVFKALYPPQSPLARAPYRAAFGLPHNYFFAPQGSREMRKEEFRGPDGQSRRASPVLIHVTRVRAKPLPRFVPNVLWLKSPLLPEKGSVGHGQARGPRDLAPPDWSAVVAFLHEFYAPGGPRGGRVPGAT